MMKILSERCCYVSCPPQENAGDSVHLDWLMERFGKALSTELFYESFCHLVKEFQTNPSKCKNLKFTLLIEEIDATN